MKGYQTESKRALMAFLEQNRSRPMTVEQIALEISGTDAPGKSTVYRLMHQLVQDGTVRRFVRGNSRQFLYQYIQKECHGHLHCRCVTCGKLVHLDEETSQNMGRLLSQSGFALDSRQTTLLGVCKVCGGQGA